MQNPHVPLCPICGATRDFWRRTDTNVRGSAIIKEPLRLLSNAHSFAGSEAAAFVCTNCGYVMLFMDPGDFRDTTPSP